MTRALAFVSFAALLSSAVFAQSGEDPVKFEIADVHSSPPSVRPFVTGPYIHGLRYELKNANMVDLVRIAYGIEPDKVVGGPSWLEFDRFDIAAKAPAGSKPEAMKEMLKALLTDRFQLAFHEDQRPFLVYSLTAGKSLKLKESDGSGDANPGCTMRSQMAPPPPPPAPGTAMAVPMSMTLISSCHNTTVAAFANSIRGLISINGNGTPAPVLDKTELKGNYDFEFKFQLQMNNGPIDTGNSIFDAVDKQLGLKLEQATLPMPVVVVDKVNRQPTPNPPDVEKTLPALPTEFDVAEIKPSTAPPGQVMMMNGMVLMAARPAGGRGGTIAQPFQNDRVNLQGYNLKNLIYLAWNLTSDDMIAGAPKWLETDRWDVIAKAPPSIATTAAAPGGRGPIDTDAYRPILRALLMDKFKMAAHYEDRPTNAYVLSGSKPKMQKADPANRTKCTEGPGPDGKDPRKANPALGRLLYCQNITMREFAALLPSLASGYLSTLVQDTTGLEEAYDFTLNFSGVGVVNGMGGRGMDASQAGPGAGPAASDPSGGLSLFDAINKQLGLKLEMQKRPAQVLVIDHLEPKPIDN